MVWGCKIAASTAIEWVGIKKKGKQLETSSLRCISAIIQLSTSFNVELTVRTEQVLLVGFTFLTWKIGLHLAEAYHCYRREGVCCNIKTKMSKAIRTECFNAYGFIKKCILVAEKMSERKSSCIMCDWHLCKWWGCILVYLFNSIHFNLYCLKLALNNPLSILKY